MVNGKAPTLGRVRVGYGVLPFNGARVLFLNVLIVGTLCFLASRGFPGLLAGALSHQICFGGCPC